MTKKTRVKSAAASFIPKSRDEVDDAIAKIGEAQRARAEIETDMNAKLASVKAGFEEKAAPHAATIKELRDGIQIYCEANRADLTRDGRTKTIKLGNGEVSWRMRPRRVTVRGEGIVIPLLRKLKLDRFIRTKEEIDKNAILAEDGAETLLAGVQGLSISQGEDFVVKPFASEIEEVA